MKNETEKIGYNEFMDSLGENEKKFYKEIVGYNEFIDSLGENEKKFYKEIVDECDKNDKDSYDEIIKKLEDKRFEPEYIFTKRHGIIKLYLIKYRLSRYIKKKEKYAKLLRKYEDLHKNLSLAVTSGFSNVKEHHQYIKELLKKVEARNGNN